MTWYNQRVREREQRLGQEQQGPPLSATDVYPEQAHAASEEFISVPSMLGDFISQEFTKKKK